MAIITLTTDFGHSDHYVAAVKGAVLSVNPGATIVDIAHDIHPQGIEQAAFVLACTLPYFPAGTIHVAVVDPGVGTARKALALTTARGVFIGPDNGLLSGALPDDSRPAAPGGPRIVPLPLGTRAFALLKSRYHRTPVSPTFHARDVFGPAAAHVSLGVDPAELGPEVAEIVALPAFRAVATEDGALIGRVIHVDRFGNVITSVRAEQLPSGGVQVEIAGRLIAGLSRTYADCAVPSALIGSCDFLEIALNGDSAERALGVGIGDSVTVRPG